MEEIVTLASLANGAPMELFQTELTRVIANIADVNTSYKTKREINIKVVIQPEEDRRLGFATVAVTSKLAAPRPVDVTVYFGKDEEGNLVAVQNHLEQTDLFATEKSIITPLRRGDK